MRIISPISHSFCKSQLKVRLIISLGYTSKKSIVLTLGIIMIALIFALPIVSVSLELFSGSKWPKTLSLYIINTLCLMISVGLITTVMGVTCAWLICAYEFPGRNLLSWALVLPIAAPAYIIAYVYADLLEYYGPVQMWLRQLFGWNQGQYWFPAIRNMLGATLMLSFVLYPYVYLLARASFLKQSQSQWWAARNLGLNPKQAFYKVVLPAARPAIAGGLALVLMETLADFGVADFFSVPTFSVGIFRNWLIVGDKASAMKLASLMLLAVILLITLETSTRRGSIADDSRTFAEAERVKVKGAKGLALMLICLFPVIIGLIIPISRLIYLSFLAGDSMTWGRLFSYTQNSITLALIVSLPLVVISIILAYAKRNAPNNFSKFFIRLSTLGYALPGALLAVGLLSPLSWLDQRLTKMVNSILGGNSGLILTGTLIALIYALSVRFLTVSFNALDSGLSRIPASIEHASSSLGANWLRRVNRIFFPLLRPSLVSAFILVFIDVVRELPATLIMRPFNFDTLATRVYWLASDERLSEASTAALIIVVVGLIPTLYLNGFIMKKANA